jgi:hypothetical protein
MSERETLKKRMREATVMYGFMAIGAFAGVVVLDSIWAGLAGLWLGFHVAGNILFPETPNDRP